MLGHTDAEIAVLLKIGDDGLKKRWRAVYARVNASDSSLIPERAAPQIKRKLILEAFAGGWRRFVHTGAERQELPLAGSSLTVPIP